MSKVTMRRPDARAMAQLLAEQTQTAAGLILRLAWRQGLTREEIQRLTWNDVDFSAHQLRLPDRTIPLETETEGCLRRQAERPDPPTPFVVVSDRRRQQMPPESISRLARKTLDRAGRHQPDGSAARLHHPPSGIPRLALCGPDQRHRRPHSVCRFLRLSAGGTAEGLPPSAGGGRFFDVEAAPGGGQLPGGACPLDGLEAGDAGPGDDSPDLGPGGSGPGSGAAAGPGPGPGRHPAAPAAGGGGTPAAG